LLESARLVAVTVTGVFTVTLGAVNSPLYEIVPALADHITKGIAVLATDAVNC